MRIVWNKYLYHSHGYLYNDDGSYASPKTKIEVSLYDFHQNKKDEVEITEFWEKGKFYYIRNFKTNHIRKRR